MATDFPTTLDSLTNPTSTDTTTAVDHAGQHSNANDAIEALEAKVGADSSAVTTSHDYKLSGVTSTDKAASLTGTEALTNKTLTSPVLNTGVSGTAIDTDGTLAANSDTLLSSQKAIKTYVAAQVTAEDLDIAGDSGTGAVDLDSQSLTVTGGTGITTSATAQAVTINVDNPVTAETTGFTIAAGTTPKTLTVALDANVAGTNTGDQLAFKTIATSSGTNPVADTITDTLNISGGTGVTVTGDETTDTVTIATTITQYTDELAQDAVGGMVDTSLTYTDATPELKVTNPVTPAATGFTITAGTTPKTLTVSDTASVTGTNTGDQTNITGNAGTVTNGVYTTDAGSVFLAPSGDGSGLSGVVTAETDPVVGAITGIVKANGAGAISAASAGTDYQAPLVADTDYLTPGTAASTYQPLDTDLTAIAALSSADSNIIVGSATGWVAESGATARTSLGVDAAGTDNSTDVTLAGTPDYLTITGQEITRGQIDLTTDVTGALPVANIADLARSGKSLTIESPVADDDISMFFTNEAITITEMRAVLIGSDTPSVTWTVRHSTDRSAAGNEVVTSGTTTTSTTTGSDVTSFNDATIPADSFVWLEVTAQSGTVTQMHLTVIFDKD